MKAHTRFLCLIAAACLITSGLTLAGDNWSEQDWVKESNANTMIVMEAQAKFSPESFASLGIEKYDEEIIDLNKEMTPRSRTDHRLPEAIYADNLKNFGVDMDPQDLIRAAQLGFGEIRNEMQAIANLIAKERGLPSSDYRDVIRELKKEQIPEDALMTG